MPRTLLNLPDNKTLYNDYHTLKRSIDFVFVGNGKVYINKAQAKRSINIATGNTGAISVVSHEVLHPIFNALIGGAKTQGEFVQQFRTRMTGKQKTISLHEVQKLIVRIVRVIHADCRKLEKNIVPK